MLCTYFTTKANLTRETPFRHLLSLAFNPTDVVFEECPYQRNKCPVEDNDDVCLGHRDKHQILGTTHGAKNLL